jgi:kynurenine formamidase
VSRLVDLSHPIRDGMAAYPGLPPVRMSALLEREASRERYEDRAEFLLGGFELAGNTGTYLDAPFHRFADGTDLAGLDLERLVDVQGVCIDPNDDDRPMRLDALEDAELRDRAVLFRTGWDVWWESDEYWRDAPFLPVETVERLVSAGARLVGIDAGNVDDTGDPSRPAHTGLLAAGIPILENLTHLAALPTDGFTVTAAPVPFVGGATFPVRAYARIA